jgi:hypothetical protein
MENLEKQIITRLKRYLLKYNLDIVNSSEVDDIMFFNTDCCLLKYNNDYSASCIYFWTSIDDMLFSADNIFTFLPNHIEHSVDFCHCAGDSLEEIIIKMDLLGV